MLNPLLPSEWTREKAAHLLNRVGFGGTPSDVDRIHSLGVELAVQELVGFEMKLDSPQDGAWTHPNPDLLLNLKKARELTDPDKKKEFLREARKQIVQEVLGMKQAWLELMLNGPRPFQEKMTLFWHGHFATSIVKVKDPYFMWLQNQIFRTFAVGKWEDMLIAVAKDPAMLIWLDGTESKKGNPNENFAREVMELFTLGEGNYTEDDIRNAAKAFVGWGVQRREEHFIDRLPQHDYSRKEFLGQTGLFTGEDILKILANSPRSGQYMMGRLWLYFCNEQPPATTVQALASEFTKAGCSFKAPLTKLFLSEDFYAPEVMRHQVKSPVQWLVSSCKYLELPLPAPILCNQFLKQLGQDLFAPPSVKGWDGGVSWITTNSLFNRYNYAGLLVQGRGLLSASTGKESKNRPELVKTILSGLHPLPVEKLFLPGETSSPAKLVAAIEDRLIQCPLKPARAKTLQDYLADKKQLDADVVRGAVQLVMATPDFQLT